MSVSIITGVAYEDGAVALMARIQSIASGANMTQASVTGITWKVFDLFDNAQIATGTLTVSSVIFDTLQTPSIWTVDTTGYNFRVDPANTTHPNGGTTYRFEFIFDPSSGEDFPVVFEVSTENLLTS